VIRVLVVDDSALVRTVLSDELTREPDIEVIGEAVDPYDAREKILRLQPDVITLDIEMPRMDGLSFLARLMKYQPMPVVIVSSLAPQNSDAALHALSLGAVEVIAKPGSARSMPDVSGQLVRAIRAAAAARVTQLPRGVPAPARAAAAGATDAEGGVAAASVAGGATGAAVRSARAGAVHQRLIVIGASTGGPTALEQVLGAMPVNAPAILIVQHMPAGFTGAFARRLHERSAITVREAVDGDLVEAGTALVAPGGRHMVLLRGDTKLRVGVRDGPPVNYQRPSVDVLFHSVARVAGGGAVGVLLTGMGADGASGMRALRDAGVHTIAQDEKTCVVFSMPREAIRFEGVSEILPLPRIAAAALNAAAAADRLSVAQRTTTR
jgi:two-component system, chemotaxis family, protein-glutamate methylesterase/glutaminase